MEVLVRVPDPNFSDNVANTSKVFFFIMDLPPYKDTKIHNIRTLSIV